MCVIFIGTGFFRMYVLERMLLNVFVRRDLNFFSTFVCLLIDFIWASTLPPPPSTWLAPVYCSHIFFMAQHGANVPPLRVYPGTSQVDGGGDGGGWGCIGMHVLAEVGLLWLFGLVFVCLVIFVLIFVKTANQRNLSDV